MSDLYNIKQATQEDLDQLAVLFNDYRIFYKQDADLEGAVKYLAERMEFNESIIFIAIERSSRGSVAFMQLYPSFSSISMERAWTLNDLYVSVDYRGQGIAQMLLERANNYAKETNSKGLSLSTANDNHVAQKLYERNGYVKDDEFVHYDLIL